MRKTTPRNKKKTSAKQTLLTILLLLLIITLGWVAYSYQDTTIENINATGQGNIQEQDQEKPKNDETTADPYDGWLTYTSLLNSGLTFRYPPDWKFDIPEEVFVNNGGGESVNAALYSTEPTRDPAPKGATAPSPANNIYMCVSFGEYGGEWLHYNWLESESPDSTEQIEVNGKTLTLATYGGSSSMLSFMILSEPNNSMGIEYIDTNNDYTVSVTARFNCVQSDQEILETSTEDFNQREEVKTAKLIMKSLSY